MKIRTLIVDDEPLARQRIRLLLGEAPDMEIIGECADGHADVITLERDTPDLLFLDVQMPGLDGFGVLTALRADAMPVVIFTTAFDQYAVRAFEAHALDYLLKPFKPARFEDALARARTALATRHGGGAAQGLLELISLQNGRRITMTRGLREVEQVLKFS